MKKYFIFIIFLVLILSISSVCAEEMNDTSTTNVENLIFEDSISDENIESDLLSESQDSLVEDSSDENIESDLLSESQDSLVEDSSDEMIVNDWEDLQYYASKTDKNYVVKLKENTNFYPNITGSTAQIIINNNLTIIGSNGSYIGDNSSNPRSIGCTPFVIPFDSGNSVFLEGVTFKWITGCSVVIDINGNTSSTLIKNCNFEEILIPGGKNCVIHLKCGEARIENCSFKNIQQGYGTVSIYAPIPMPKKPKLFVDNCYFENCHATTAPGGINNCGELILKNTTFYKNSASYWSGALHTDGKAKSYLYDCKFIDNVAGWNGGAMYCYGYIEIYNTSFIGNNCTTNNGGGAIGAYPYGGAPPHIHIEDCLFKDNNNLCWALDELSTEGTGQGGAISARSVEYLKIYNTTFIHNGASLGTAIWALIDSSYGLPYFEISGNKFINHTRAGDVIVMNKVSASKIHDNYYLNNSIAYSDYTLVATNYDDNSVSFEVLSSLKYPYLYDPNILDKCEYDIYVDGIFLKKVSGSKFTITFEDSRIYNVSVVASISSKQSNIVPVNITKKYIYLSKERGNDDNDGLTTSSPVFSLKKAIDLAKITNNIIILDGEFNEENLIIDYDLTIRATNNAMISNGVVSNSIFTINNSNLTLKKLKISNLKMLNDSSCIIKQNHGSLILDDCIVEYNLFNKLIESDIIEMYNTFFKNNNGSIESQKLSIVNTIFDNNSAEKSLIYCFNGETSLINSTFTNNYNGIIYSNSNLNIVNSIFKNNMEINNSSGIIVDNLSKLNIIASIFINNFEYSPLIFLNDSNSSVNISDSILIANSIKYENGLIDGKINNVVCNGNWWGNTQNNLNILPNLNSKVKCDNWLFLNISSDSKELEYNKNAVIKLNLNYLISKNGLITNNEHYNLPNFAFLLSPDGGNVNKNNIELVDGLSEVIYTLNNLEKGYLKINYDVFESIVEFQFIKSNPKIVIDAEEITFGECAYIIITVPQDATGNISLKFLNILETKQINGSKIIFTFDDLNIGNYSIQVNYTGDNLFSSFSDNFTLCVNKLKSFVKISVGDIKVNEDVILTFDVPIDATGNITVSINDILSEVIPIHDAKAYYIIKNITRGDWNIKAIYNGDSVYQLTENYTKFGADKLNTKAIINVIDGIYNEETNIEIILDNNVTGEIIGTIDSQIITKPLDNGKAFISFSNLDAGSKKAQIFYTGDNNYNNATFFVSFFIEKTTTTFNISSTDIKEGQDAIINLKFNYGVSGTVTLTCDDIKETLTIPKSGLIQWRVSDLAAGLHNVSAKYNGDNNYYSTRNNVQVNVSTWNLPQWDNDGSDSKNSGKSEYVSDANGEILWNVETSKEITGNIIIDYEGNIYVIAGNTINSFDKNGLEIWTYNSYNNFSGMVVGRDVIISPVSGDTVYFINKTGENYGISNIYKGSSIFVPVIDENYNIYISGERDVMNKCYNLVVIPYKLWEFGGTPLTINLGDSNPTSAPVIVRENIVCVATENGLKIVDISQEKVISSLDMVTNVRPVVDESGIIYIITSDEIISIDPNGNQLWKSNITCGEAKYLAIDSEKGLLYSINKEGNLFKYDILNSGVETLISNLNITTGILIGNDGTLYFGVNTTFLALNSNGKYLWKSDLGKTITGTPIMDAEGNIYVTGNTTLFAITNAPLKAPKLVINSSNVEYGDDLIVSVNFNKECTGIINANIDGRNYSCEIIDGLAKITIPNLVVGNYNIIVSYTGDKRYSADEKIISVNITKAESNNDAINIPDKIGINKPNFSIDLPSDATGSLTVEVDGIKYSAELENGSATVNVPKLSSGNHNIIVSYSGDENYAPITTNKTINVPLPKLINNKNIVMDYKDGSSYKVQLIGSDGKVVVGDYVIFNVNGRNIKVKTDNKGYASLVITETPKIYKITASYNGVSVKNTVTVKQILKSGNYKVKKSAKKLVLKATLKSSKGKAIKGKQITFKFKGKTYKVKTNKKGIAKVTIKKKVIKKLKAKKKYALKIIYLKDTIKKTVSVKK